MQHNTETLLPLVSFLDVDRLVPCLAVPNMKSIWLRVWSRLYIDIGRTMKRDVDLYPYFTYRGMPHAWKGQCFR